MGKYISCLKTCGAGALGYFVKAHKNPYKYSRNRLGSVCVARTFSSVYGYVCSQVGMPSTENCPT